MQYLLADIANHIVRFFQRWMPDPFVISLLLTALAFLLSMGIGYSPSAALTDWGNGLWHLLEFASQVGLTFIFGYALAFTGPVNKLLRYLAAKAQSPRGAYALVALVSAVTALFSWSLCLVAGAVMARITGEVCRERDIKVHYPLLAAAGFAGFGVWHQGMSSSIGLVIATPGHFLENQIGRISAEQTIFTTWNVVLALTVVVLLPVLVWLLHPRAPSNAVPRVRADDKEHGHADENLAHSGPAAAAENSRLISSAAGLALGLFILLAFIRDGATLNLNFLNGILLASCLLLVKSPKEFVALIADGGRLVALVFIQFPLYAGISAIISLSGLGQTFTDFFTAIASAETMPFWSFVSAAILNVLIPSGGGQWAVQGEFIMSAAQAIGADLPRTAMAVAIGDQWTTLIHPLPMIPMAAITGLSVRDIVGYTFMIMLFLGVVFAGALLLF